MEHRVELCRRAVAGDERLDVSLVDAEVPGPSFTVDTLQGCMSAARETI